MKQGETISGEVNSTGGTVTLSVVLRGVVMQSERVSGMNHYQFTATTPGTYELDLASTEPTVVSMDIFSR